MRPSPIPLPKVAFTLIELLVVVAIIAVLAGMLLPGLVRAKNTARRTACLSSMRQWGIGITLYLHENDDRLPRESFGSGTVLNNWAQVKDPSNNDVWYNGIPPLIGQPRAGDYFNRRAAFYERESFFQCPGARFPRGYAQGNNPLFSISMNSKLIESPRTTLSVIEVRQPASTVMFLENLLQDEVPVDPAQPTTDLGQPSSYASRFVARHDRRGNLVFVDGHVETFAGDQVVETASGPSRGKAIVPQTRIVWTPVPSQNPN